jgi:hypothetical protein
MALEDGDYYWNSALGSFVYSAIDETCPAGQTAAWTPDTIQCVPMPAIAEPSAPASSPSPDDRWMVRVEDGIWLEDASGARMGPIGAWSTLRQVIWRPDSLGFFLVAEQELYYVSVPGILLTLVDNKVSDHISYQWLDARSP